MLQRLYDEIMLFATIFYQDFEDLDNQLHNEGASGEEMQRRFIALIASFLELNDRMIFIANPIPYAKDLAKELMEEAERKDRGLHNDFSLN